MMDEPDMDEQEARIAEYALGLLSPQEAKAFEDAMAGDAVLRASYAIWVENLVSLTDDIAPVAPPASVWSRTEAKLFAADPGRTKPSLLRRWGLAPVGFVGLAAAVAFAVFINIPVQSPPFNPAYHAEVVSEDGTFVVQAGFDPATATLRVIREAAEPRPDRVLELWVIAGDNPPVSLGVLPEDQTVDLPVPVALQGAVQGGLLAISDEPPGGSPTGAPTGDVLAVGPLTLL
ncbi:anti-sigma factor [Flavimaricola marinus]|uniref:Anti-sigma-K factor rskA n=1 Tax=Flavimaricola marinus TaxID=1819565 RepID=A0A238LDP5_9RHOB|nr:anti-sigma factor [Flavimaricola marinus]SMY07738.1 Anti-sigma-K factor rskA [Flavimaricola marinus]